MSASPQTMAMAPPTSRTIASGLAQGARGPTRDESRRRDPAVEASTERERGTGAVHSFGEIGVHTGLPVRIQAHLVVGRPGDRYEEEADRAADLVTGASEGRSPDLAAEPLAPLRRRPREGHERNRCEAESEPGLEQRIGAASAEGHPLPADQRAFYETRFGHDFGAVRVHAGPRSAAAAAAAGAQAFTHGQDVYFGAGFYRPGTDRGSWLMAHELAHTIQQSGPRGSAAPTILRKAAGPAADSDPSSVADDPAKVAGVPESGLKGDAAEAPLPADQGATTGQPELKLGKAGELGKGPGKPESEAGVKDLAKKVGVKDQTVAAAKDAAAAEGKEDDKAKAAEASAITDLSTGGLALIDTELAEHQRWGGAAAKVGAAESGERAKFIAAAAAKGSSFTEGLVKGAGMGAAIKVGEKLIEKGATKIATQAAARLGTQVAKFTPLPAVGAVIGGVISAYELAKRDWKATGETIGRFGKGASLYEELANSIEAISTVIDVATQVLNVIAGVIGAISIAMWVITVLTVGIASPLAATLSTIAVGIGLATLALDAINALVLKQLVVIFRSLHAFTSEADPRDVVTQGNAIGQAAGAATGFVGGLAGGIAGGTAVEKGSARLASTKKTPPVPEHPTPGAASGEGPTVKAEPPETGLAPKDTEGVPSTKAEPADTAGAVKDAEPAPSVKAEPAETGVAPKEAQGGQPEATTPAKTEAVPPPEAQTSGATKAGDAGTGGAPKKAGGGPKKGGGGKGGGGPKKLTKKQLEAMAKKSDLSNADIQALADHLGVTPEDVRARFARAARDTTVDERTKMSPGGALDPEFAKIPERPFAQTAKEIKRTKELTGQGTMSKSVEKSLRETSKENAIREYREAAADEGKQTYLTQESRENIAEHGLEFLEPAEGGTAPEYHQTRGFGFVEEGDVHKSGMAKEFEESHIVPIKQDPAHATKGASIFEGKKKHFGETHGTVPAAELEALTRRAEPSPGLQTEFSKTQGVIVENRKILQGLEKRIEKTESKARTAERRAERAEKGGRTEQAKAAREEAQQLREEGRNLEIQAKKMRDGLPELEAIVASASKEQRKDLGRAAQRRAPANTATGSTPATAQGAQPQPASPATATPTPPVQQPVTTPSPSVPGQTSGTGLETVSSLSPAAHVGAHSGGGQPTSGEDLNRDMPELGHMDRGPISSGEKGLYYAGWSAMLGTPGTAVADATFSGYEKARREPIVEHVNPNYPPPPCTPQEIVDVQNQILETLDARAQAEAASAAMAKEEAHHKDNEKPLADMQEKTGEAITATDAHKDAVARRTEANKGKEKKEGEVDGALSDYSTQAAKLATITVPMRGFERFTSLASSLPDSPDVLVGAKRGILKMNADSKKFLNQLDSIEQTINAQKAGKGARDQQIKDDANTLEKTDSGAKESHENLDKAQHTTEELDGKNQTQLKEATKLRTDADRNVSTLNNQEQQKRAEAEGMAAALQQWAQTHRQARVDALEATKSRLEQQGYKVIEAKES
jgi:hypothetical protein